MKRFRQRHSVLLLFFCIAMAACSSKSDVQDDSEPEAFQYSGMDQGLQISWKPASQELLAKALSSGKMRRVSVQSKWNVLARIYSVPLTGYCVPERPRKIRKAKVQKEFSSSSRYGGKVSRRRKPDICGHHLVFTIGSKYDPDQFDAFDLGEFGELKTARSHYDRNKEEAFVILTVARFPRRVASKNKRLMQETKQFSIQVFPNATARLVSAGGAAPDSSSTTTNTNESQTQDNGRRQPDR